MKQLTAFCLMALAWYFCLFFFQKLKTSVTKCDEAEIMFTIMHSYTFLLTTLALHFYGETHTTGIFEMSNKNTINKH